MEALNLNNWIFKWFPFVKLLILSDSEISSFHLNVNRENSVVSLKINDYNPHMNVLCKENPPQNTCIFLNEILGNLLKICLMTAERQNCSQKAILYFLFKSDASNSVLNVSHISQNYSVAFKDWRFLWWNTILFKSSLTSPVKIVKNFSFTTSWELS